MIINENDHVYASDSRYMEYPDDGGSRLAPTGYIELLFDQTLSEPGFDLVDIEADAEQDGCVASFFSNGVLSGTMNFVDLIL